MKIFSFADFNGQFFRRAVFSLAATTFLSFSITAPVHAQEADDLKVNKIQNLFDLTQKQLDRKTADFADKWDALNTTPNADEFEQYYEIFEFVKLVNDITFSVNSLDIEDTKTSWIYVKNEYDVLAKRGINLQTAASRTLESLIASDVWFSTRKDNIDEEKGKYILLLHVLEDGYKASSYTVGIAELAAKEGFTTQLDELISKVLPRTLNKVTDIQQRSEIANRVAKLAPGLVPLDVLPVLTDALIFTKPEGRKPVFTAIRDGLGANGPVLFAPITARDDSIGILAKCWSLALAQSAGGRLPYSFDTLVADSTSQLDTRGFQVLLANETGTEQGHTLFNKLIDQQLASGFEVRALQSWTDLGYPQRDFSKFLDIVRRMSDQKYGNLVSGASAKVFALMKAGQLNLSDDQKFEFIDILVKNGEDKLLQDFAAAGNASELIDLADLTLEARINGALFASKETPFPSMKVEVPSGAALNPDLVAIAGLINRQVLTDKVGDGSGEKNLRTMYRTLGAHLWVEPSRRKDVLQFVGSTFADWARVELVRGAVETQVFNPYSEDGLALAEAIAASTKTILASNQSATQAMILSAAIGNPVSDDLVAGLTPELATEYKTALAHALILQGKVDEAHKLFPNEDPKTSKVLLPLLVSEAIYGNFLQSVEVLKTVEDSRARAAAFKDVAFARAQLMDDRNWLDPKWMDEGAPKRESPLVRNSGEVFLSNGSSNLAYGDESQIVTNKRPAMPSFQADGTAVTMRIPLPNISNSELAVTGGVAVGGESRDVRLTRFPSEHYEDIQNLGVRDHMFFGSQTVTSKFIFVNGGIVTLGQVYANAVRQDPDAMTEKDGILTIRKPIAVSKDATLIISGREFKEIRLSQDDTVFLVNSGNLYIDNINIVAWNIKAGKSAKLDATDKGIHFRPFMLSWSGSGTYASNSNFVGLGYSGGRTYGVSLSSGPDDEIYRTVKPASPTGMFIDNSFDNLYYGFYAFEAKDVLLIGNEYRDGVIYGLDPHDFSSNLSMAYNAAYGTHKKHGIIISREVNDSFIVGNLSFDNHGSGVMLDRKSSGTIVYGNTLMRNVGDGFAALESPCALVSSNWIEGNNGSGVKVRNSWDIYVEGNSLMRNRKIGVEGYIDNLRAAAGSEFRNFKKDPFTPVTTMAVYDNVMTGNQAGIVSRGASSVTLYKNRFIYQLPRYVGGDIKPFALQAVSESMKKPVVFQSSCMPKVKEPEVCSLAETQAIGSDVLSPRFQDESANADMCVTTPSAVQGRSFKTVN